MPYHIAIIGSGPVGVALAKQLVEAGHLVTISNSRGPESLKKQATDTGAKPVDIKVAAKEADYIILATPVASIVALSQTLETSLRPGKIIIDTCNYYPSRDGRVEAIDKGEPDTVWVASHFSIPVVKVFNNIIAANMVTSAKAKDSPNRVILPVSANDSDAKRLVIALVDDIGFDAYDAGALAESWRYQAGQPAYCTEPTEQSQLVRLLAKADREQGPVNRDKVRALFEKLPEGYSPQTLLRVSRLSAGLDKWSIRSWFAAVAFLIALVRGTIRKPSS